MTPKVDTLQYFSIILFILFNSRIYVSAGNNANYTVCKNNPFSCGNITNVGYPFWGGNRPQFCGRRGFGLTCQNGQPDVPVINRMGTTNGAESFNAIVVSINTTSNTMSLVQNLFSQNTSISCENLIRNETKITLSQPFKFSPLVANMNLFFDCNNTSTTNYGGRLKFVTCDEANTTINLPYYVDKPENAGNISKLCPIKRVFPVLKSELDELKKGNVNLSRVLNKGFEVKYTVDFNTCTTCQNSGGVCGSSADNKMRFTCYCQDGTHTAHCPIPGAQISVKCLNIIFCELCVDLPFQMMILVFLLQG
ncbi:LEAF RUST 10 DISEASE-RESISTANCE LOCUS RECEPTOR-LIKE PROTEIN KINASE-like 2.7 [Silene latifolia]|uniref:LEAF RUST 10 DISEASE-RESISTANCE LOCUS RECEPTOR-LIKE PROTEIN KINASE-like 2.7 n=1 Tax=Silene latifolia TaxID=37657 RepID=UPI003D787DC0